MWYAETPLPLGADRPPGWSVRRSKDQGKCVNGFCCPNIRTQGKRRGGPGRIDNFAIYAEHQLGENMTRFAEESNKVAAAREKLPQMKVGLALTAGVGKLEPCVRMAGPHQKPPWRHAYVLLGNAAYLPWVCRLSWSSCGSRCGSWRLSSRRRWKRAATTMMKRWSSRRRTRTQWRPMRQRRWPRPLL